MKTYTPALINKGKVKTTFKTFFFGNAAARGYYYSARHKTDEVYLLWIESTRFNTTFCFPCVLEEQGDPMIYVGGKGAEHKANNAAVIQRWGLFANPQTIEEEYEVKELTPNEFYEEYNRYKRRAMEEIFAEPVIAEKQETPALEEAAAAQNAAEEPADEPVQEGEGEAE